VRLAEVVPGAPYDAHPLARVAPGVQLQPVPAAPLGQAGPLQAQAYVPVPGPKGDPGNVAGTLPWEQITGRPQPAQETYAVHAVGSQQVLLAYAPRPGSLALYFNGLREFDLSDLTLDGNRLTIPETWPLGPGDVLALTYTH
jgi:hypothetical protein